MNQLAAIDNGKMFKNGRFHELKGSSFNPAMKRKFVDFFARKPYFELYYIVIENEFIKPAFTENTARAFNFVLKLAIQYFINQNMLPNEPCMLQLDERNERTQSRYFLEDYLNTELLLTGVTTGRFDVTYFDSANNSLVQVADVLSNLCFSNLLTSSYNAEMQKLEKSGILKFVFRFPLSH